MLFRTIRCWSLKETSMSVTICPDLAAIPLVENGFSMGFSAFSSEKAHMQMAFFAALMASDCYSPLAVMLKSGIYAVYPSSVEVKTIG